MTFDADVEFHDVDVKTSCNASSLRCLLPQYRLPPVNLLLSSSDVVVYEILDWTEVRLFNDAI